MERLAIADESADYSKIKTAETETCREQEEKVEEWLLPPSQQALPLG